MSGQQFCQTGLILKFEYEDLREREKYVVFILIYVEIN